MNVIKAIPQDNRGLVAPVAVIKAPMTLTNTQSAIGMSIPAAVPLALSNQKIIFPAKDLMTVARFDPALFVHAMTTIIDFTCSRVSLVASPPFGAICDSIPYDHSHSRVTPTGEVHVDWVSLLDDLARENLPRDLDNFDLNLFCRCSTTINICPVCVAHEDGIFQYNAILTDLAENIFVPFGQLASCMPVPYKGIKASLYGPDSILVEFYA